jgi:hypothetical protein
LNQLGGAGCPQEAGLTRNPKKELQDLFFSDLARRERKGKEEWELKNIST